jgi:hypothetical protein
MRISSSLTLVNGHRHGRFRDSDLLHELFETTVRRGIEEGLVEGVPRHARRCRLGSGERGGAEVRVAVRSGGAVDRRVERAMPSSPTPTT